MKIEIDDKGLVQVIDRLGITVDSLLGQGGEAWVLALGEERIARVNRSGTNRAQVDGRTALLNELGRSANNVPFAIPAILDTLEIEGKIVTIEKRLPGRPLDQVLAEKTGEAREALIRAYLETAAQIGDLTLTRPWYGDLADTNAIRATAFREFLEKRAARSLKAAGPEFEAVDPAQLAAALPEPNKASFVHLDAFPGNMMADEDGITAVIDFGASAIMGDRRLDPLTAVVYLAPAMTPAATKQDRAAAQEWLVDRGLGDMFTAAQNWIAAYWSFAQDDIPLYQWCQAILLG
jgi:Ser/Thr protein kinase RdoA (MazF antagonist)